MFGNLVIAYLFFGGASAGAFFVMAAGSIALRRSTGNPRLLRALGQQQRNVYAVAMLVFVLAGACLFWDLGRPDRILLVVLHPHATVLTFGTITISCMAVLGALLLAACRFRTSWSAGRPLVVLEVACCICAVAMMAYTALFLIDNGRPFWETWTLVGLFLASSLSSGVSIVLLVDYLTQGTSHLLRIVKPMQRAHLACLACEAVFLALFMADVMANPAAQDVVGFLLSDEMLPVAVVGVVGFGVVAPAMLEAYALSRKDARSIPVSDVLCLAGGLCLRYVVIACGVH